MMATDDEEVRAWARGRAPAAGTAGRQQPRARGAGQQPPPPQQEKASTGGTSIGGRWLPAVPLTERCVVLLVLLSVDFLLLQIDR